MKIIRIFVVVGLGFVFGCATTDYVVQTKNLMPLSSMKSRISNISAKGKINILGFVDGRESPASIGVAKTGLKNSITPIKLDQSLGEYLKFGLSEGFAKRGVIVTGDAPFSFSGTIKEFSLNEATDVLAPESANCSIKIEFTVISTQINKSTYKGSVSASVSGTDNILDATDSLGPALHSCVEFVVEKLIEDAGFTKAVGISQ